MSTQHHVSTTNTRKRGRDDVDTRDIDVRSFTIKPDASEPFATPRTFTPVCLLSRAQLPLAYLDTTSSGSRLFSAHVSTLETAYEYDDDATVLVATETKEKKLYAIERAERRVYALCRLGEWVKEEDVLRGARCVLTKQVQLKRRALQPVEDGKPWWTSAVVDPPEACQAQGVAQLALDMRVGAEKVAEVALPVCEDRSLQEDSQTHAVELDATGAMPTPADVTQELSKQYLEALYLSRTSLAYFTKGPLSRARATFTAMPSVIDTSELVGFLRQSILTSVTMDKKFKDGICAIVNELPVAGSEAAEGIKKTKRKRKWKPKRDKHGFFVDEKDLVERWWLEHDNAPLASSSTETVDQTLRRRLPKLRSRETFLQLILILETLALESSVLPCEPGNRLQATTADEAQAPETHGEDQSDKKSKPKAKQDLPALLETLLDKLCIWHSLETHSPNKKGGAEAGGIDGADDDLKSFCVGVVVPFYVSRLPQYANIVNKKLGGPSAPTPVKRKTTGARKPGEPAVRQAPEKQPRKPLTRVATETLNQPGRRVPALNRSATDTDALALYIKREVSEVPIETIPAAGQQRKPRQSLMHTLDSTKRQIDLSAMTQANKMKLQRKAETDASIQSAIDMLRKPNRAAAVAELRESTDQSFAKATSATRGRTNAGSQRAGTAKRPPVTATPSHRKSVKATPYRRAADALETERTQSSGTTHVTSSSVRIAQTRDMVPSSSFAIPQTGHRPRHSALGADADVEETPSRGFAKFMPAGLARQPGTLESPTASRKIAATPSKPVRSLSLSVTATPLVAASPNVQRHEALLGRDTRVEQLSQSKSIYDALGWAEDEYEELT